MFSGNAHENNVEQHGYNCHGQLRNHFGRTVITGLQQFAFVKREFGNMQSLFVCKEENQTDNSRNALSDAGCQSSTGNAELKDNNKEIIQYCVGNTSADRQKQTERWSPCCHKVGLE